MEKHILIVDDDSRNIFALTAVLKSRGFKVLSTTGAEEAIEILRSDQSISALLIDMMMPDLDGYSAIPIIRAIGKRKKLPIIAVTAQAMVGDREKCLEAGADGYVSKPIDIDVLMKLLNSF